MAKLFHRKLSPHLNSTSSTNGSTYRCTDFCDPACGNLEDCYSFPEPQELLPPLPPPIPPISIVVSPATPTPGIQISPAVIIIVIVLASMFLLVSCYTIVIKYCKLCNHFIISRDHDEPPPQVDNNTQGDSHLTESFMHDDENGHHNPVVDHPVWLISTIGLQQSVINSITMVRYKRDDGLIDGTDCPVCLSEFQEGETLRLLPKCKHAFHIDCIDTWLRSHTNCPLCRAAIMANSGRQSLASNNPSLGPSRRIELTQMADSGSSEDVEPGNNQTGDDNRVVDIRVENNVDHHNNNEQNKAPQNGFNVLIRRSLSMDFFRGSGSETVGSWNSQGISLNSSSIRVMSSSCSSSRPQPPTGSLFKRSYSWSDRVFCSSSSSQHNRNQDMSP